MFYLVTTRVVRVTTYPGAGDVGGGTGVLTVARGFGMASCNSALTSSACK